MSDPPRLAEGTATSRYAPLVGDIVTVNTACLDPALGLYGVRVGIVMPHDTITPGHAVVRLPGFLALFVVPLTHVELLYRKPVTP